MTPSKPFQTTDLHLATFLILEGCEYELVKHGESKRGHPIGLWMFKDDSDKRVQALVIKYNEGSAQVDPRGLLKLQAQVRNDMYEFLGIKRKG